MDEDTAALMDRVVMEITNKEPSELRLRLNRDNSTNYSIQLDNSDEVFKAVQGQIREGVEDAQLRAELVSKTAELEAAVKAKERPKFLKAYGEWVALAANHMKLLGPWIPALTKFLTE